MVKRIRNCLPACILSLMITACHMETGGPGNYGAETTGRESGTWVEDAREEADFILPESASRLYGRHELEALSKEQLRLARNEIYARHGRRFKDDALQSYFQSKMWYQGTVEPDEFDESRLNQIERDNLNLLLRLEQEATENLKTGGREDSDGIHAPTKTGYVDIVKEHPCNRLYLSTDDGSNRSAQPPQVIDRGSCYEVTNGRILAETCYNRNLIDGKGIGDTLQLDDTVYRITTADALGLRDLGNVYLEYLSGPEEADFMGYYMLEPVCEDNDYILVGEDNIAKKDTVYSGSLYFSKDCITMVNNPEDGFMPYTVSISDYLTNDKRVVRSQFGLDSSGSLDLWGGFECDSSGLIISYWEAFVP